MKFKLPKDALLILDGLLDNPHARNRALLIIDKSDASDDVKNAFREAIKSIGEPKMQNLKDALQVEGMKEYIDSVVSEKTQELQAKIDKLQQALDDANQNVQKLSDEKTELEKVKNDANELQQKMRSLLVDQIADLALALRKPEINLEAIEDSLKAYKESLADKEEKELQKLYDSLRAELHSTFTKEPSETVDNNVPKKNGATQDDDTSDGSHKDGGSEGDEIEVKDIASFLKALSRQKDDN